VKRQKEWGNDVLTQQPMDWPVVEQANGLVGSKSKMTTHGDAGLVYDEARQHSPRGRHTRTFSTLKKTHSFLPPLFAQQRRIKTRLFVPGSVLQTDKKRTAHTVVFLIVHSVDNTRPKHV